ncbi:hypothetical protein PUN4_320048 [Paraburkholderia unamae]|nr:hypothetical protein PUN4_320048 [Paraburkholderia unamae]
MSNSCTTRSRRISTDSASGVVDIAGNTSRVRQNNRLPTVAGLREPGRLWRLRRGVASPRICPEFATVRRAGALPWLPWLSFRQSYNPSEFVGPCQAIAHEHLMPPNRLTPPSATPST